MGIHLKVLFSISDNLFSSSNENYAIIIDAGIYRIDIQ